MSAKQGAMSDLPNDLRLSEPERCKTLLARSGQGTLCTLSVTEPGFPFGSLVQYALTPELHPLLLVSRLAEHTRNFESDPRASLCVAEPAHGQDPLQLGRVTVVGRLELVDKEEQRERYLESHPGAAFFFGFKDFVMLHLVPQSLRHVGGFGTMSWVSAEQFAAAELDPVAPFAESVITHMNEDHAEAVGLLAGGPAALVGVDRYGFDLRPSKGSDQRVAFSQPVTTPDEVRAEMVRLTRAARAAVSA